MKKVVILIIILLFSIPFSFQFPYLCCRDKNTLQQKCYRSGVCCNGKWYPISCYDFEIWVLGRKTTIGVPSKIDIYIRNTGAYVDTYNIKYKLISGNAIIDPVDGDTITVYPENTGILSMNLIVLSASDINIEFNSTSLTTGISKKVTVTFSGDSMYSMPEFTNILVLLFLIFSISIIYSK
ncbi:MAG: hypothetical protein QXO21_03655, partial [Candidatus Anstonellales archaeon]